MCAGAVWRPPPAKRGDFLHARLVCGASAQLRVRRLGGDRAGEMRLTRLLRNPKVTPEEMVATAAARTAARCQGRDVLAIQDTTVVRSQGGGGLYLHPVIVTDLDSGALLGLAHAAFLARGQNQAATRRQRAVEDKQSQRWLDGAAAAARVCAAAQRVTVVADREADIYAAFARRPANVTLLIRAAHDRALDDGGRLFARLDAQPVAGRAALQLPAGPGRRARQTEVAARFMTARLRRPRNGLSEDLPEALEVTLVDIREANPPAGQTPVHWRLITTRAVGDAAEAFAVAELYRRRWAIEQLFRTLKTGGFDIEGIGIEDQTPLSNLVMAALAAVSVQQLVHARDGAPNAGSLRPLTDAFEPEDKPVLQALCRQLEGKTERQKNPHPPASLAYGAWVCARFGGAGPATMASQGRWSCMPAGNTSRPPSTAPLCTGPIMCESASPQAGEGEDCKCDSPASRRERALFGRRTMFEWGSAPREREKYAMADKCVNHGGSSPAMMGVGWKAMLG